MFLLVVVGVQARLYRVNAPILGPHAVRRADTAAVARNFYEGSMNILYPQVDWRGNSAGYVESEFPIYTYLVALLYQAFGPYEGLGRVLNIAVYTLSALLLFRFVRRLFNDRIALLAVYFYSVVPLSLVYTSGLQPDALMALGSLAGIYFFWIWTEENRWTALALSTLGIALAILIKPTSLYLGIPLLYLCWRKFGWQLLHKPVRCSSYPACLSVVFPRLQSVVELRQHIRSFCRMGQGGHTLFGRSALAFPWQEASAEAPFSHRDACGRTVTAGRVLHEASTAELPPVLVGDRLWNLHLGCTPRTLGSRLLPAPHRFCYCCLDGTRSSSSLGQ